MRNPTFGPVYWYWRLRATVFFGLPGVILLIDRDAQPLNLGLGLLLASIAAIFLAVNLAIYRWDRRRASGAQAPAGAQDPVAYCELQLDDLRLLAIFHYVVAVVAGLLSLFPIIQLVIVIAAITGQLDDKHGHPPPALAVWFLVAFAGTWMILGFIFAFCLVLAGWFLAHRRRYMYCLVTACVECMFVPFGTALGVFTILVLSRSSVKDLFGQRLSPA